MGFWQKLTGELVDIVEWPDASRDVLVYRFARYENEIKYGAQLIVREGQTAVFVNKGSIADLFRPGMYTLQTENLPILSSLQGWKYGFQSPFKAEVYFANTVQLTGLKWGTKNPIMMHDAQIGPVRLRAFGTYTIRVIDPIELIREFTGTTPRFTVEQIHEQLRDMLIARFADSIGEAKIPAFELAAHYDEIGAKLAEKINQEFQQFGLEVPRVLIENISLPPEVEAAIDRRSSMGVIGDMQAYTQYQTATAIDHAAQNPNGLAGGGMGMGMGMAMANQMSTINQQPQQAPSAPPPVPQQAAYYLVVNGQQAGPYDLATLQGFVNQGQLTRDTLVWCTGMANWTAAGSVQGLASLFNHVPPPLPPQEG